MVTTYTIQVNSSGTVKIMRGKEYIMSFTNGCMAMAEEMCAELNIPAAGRNLEAIKAKYRARKKAEGVNSGKRSRLPAGNEDIRDMIQVEDGAEAKERRIGYSTGLTQEEVDLKLVLLPIQIDLARDAKAKAQKAQAEVAKLWYESHEAWKIVAETVLGIDKELRKALEQILAPEGSEL